MRPLSTGIQLGLPVLRMRVPRLRSCSSRERRIYIIELCSCFSFLKKCETRPCRNRTV